MIFYFSGTGNTAWAATKAANATGEELINISDIINGDCCFRLKDEERIGFFFPVHGWRPPMIVRKFIDKLSLKNTNNNYCYAICTAGDDIGETIDILQKDLQAKGLHADSALSLIMPESYVGLPFMDVDKPEKEKTKKETADKELNAFLKSVINNERNVFSLKRGHWPRINSRLLGHVFVNHLITDKPFHVSEDKCTKCGICAQVCPTDNIIGGHGLSPKWKLEDNCLTCFACYHHCPQHAIEFGKRTKNKGQYWYSKNNNDIKE